MGPVTETFRLSSYLGWKYQVEIENSILDIFNMSKYLDFVKRVTCQVNV